MKLLITLPNGEEIDLFDEGPNGMDYVCTVSGEHSTGVITLVEEYEQSKDPHHRKEIAEEIWYQSYFYADSLAIWDEDLQSMIGLDDLAMLIYSAIITFTRI